ncbi:MAG: sigma-54 dependent transcriptional regulator [Planctomycetota bacterium]|nr:sigma-54 dependent transcriptional regulator [Planctomycetota bacterium]
MAKVLVVEDEEGMQEFLRQALQLGGNDVSCAARGDEALAELERSDFDIVLLDIFLPGFNGIEVLKKIKEAPDSPEVIMISGGAPISTVVNAMKIGAWDYVEKPIDVDHLDTLMHKAIERVRLKKENVALRRVTRIRSRGKRFIYDSPPMQELARTIELVAPTDSTVLIEGESGTGKELVANLVHQKSDRSEKTFIAINCGTLQEQLLESELFGHEKGSFTGAHERHQGLFEIADGGTIFLDEIGEMGMELQVKLLRVLENREFRRIGGSKTIRVDVRVVAATNKTLLDEIETGGFRKDLFYRLNVILLAIPALRERKEEIPELVENFQNSKFPRERRKVFTPEAMAALQEYDWPGNVRELENAVERAVILTRAPEVNAQDITAYLPARNHGGPPSFGPNLSLAEIERIHITNVLKDQKGNKVRSAKILGINVKTLYNKIKAYDI